jgi:hypothetical protein
MLGKQTKAYGDIESNLQGLIHGLVVSIDPSIGSTSSMPGWAVYRRGELINADIFVINPAHSVPDRLRTLHNHVRRLYKKYNPDVLVYEDIPAQRQGGGNANAHSSLLKALGVILSVPGPDGYVGLMPVSWKGEARDTYTKSDVNDAIEMGYVAITVAKRIQAAATDAERKK